MSISRTGFHYNHSTGLFALIGSVTNTSGSSIPGPISLVVDNLPASATLFGIEGDTLCATPQGSPYINIGNIGAGQTLAPGASISGSIDFHRYGANRHHLQPARAGRAGREIEMKRNLLLQLPLAFALASAAKADIYTVTLNTSPLTGNGPFKLDLQFLDGSGTPGDLNNNVVTLTSFAFGAGGSALGSGTATGGASGGLTAGVTLKDTVFFNEYIENFTPGSLLSFTLNTTNNADPGGTPDLFTLAILDSLGSELPTTGPAEEFLDIALTSGTNAQDSEFGSWRRLFARRSQRAASKSVAIASSRAVGALAVVGRGTMLVGLALGARARP